MHWEVERQQTEIPERMALQVNKIKILKRICGEAYPFFLCYKLEDARGQRSKPT